MTADVMPVFFQIFPFVDNESGGFDPTRRKRLIAQVPAEVTLDTLNGVSGGPIYALKQGPEGLDMYLAGVQNMEKKSIKTIAACPSDLFQELMAKGFADIQRQLGVMPAGSRQP